MIPAGYMAKRVNSNPAVLDTLRTKDIVDIYSLSNCISEDFTDYINYWKHNGYWLFDSPSVIEKLAQENSITLERTTLFYYEVYEFEYDEEEHEWIPFGPEPSFRTEVLVPEEKHLEGYDVVTFSAGTSPECSPLSCNGLASNIKTNLHCLLESFEEAKQHLEQGKFDNSEPGPFRIFAVYTLNKS